MHACPECGQACDCDGEDIWHDWPFNFDCTHECETEDEDEPWWEEDNELIERRGEVEVYIGRQWVRLGLF